MTGTLSLVSPSFNSRESTEAVLKSITKILQARSVYVTVQRSQPPSNTLYRKMYVMKRGKLKLVNDCKVQTEAENGVSSSESFRSYAEDDESDGEYEPVAFEQEKYGWTDY